MTDVTVEQNETGQEVEVIKAFVVPLKGGCGHVTLDDIDAVPIEQFRYIIQQGLEAIVNSVGMSKLLPGITKLEGADLEKAKDAVRKQARANLEDIKKGTIKLKGARSAVKVEGAVQIEAMRLAKEMVKDLIRNSDQKIGAYKASEITSAAKNVLEANPDLFAKAQANLNERAGAAKTTKALDLKSMFGAKAESEEVKAKPKGANLKKAREAKASEAKGSAEGQTRAKPKADAAKVAPRAGVKEGHHTVAH